MRQLLLYVSESAVSCLLVAAGSASIASGKHESSLRLLQNLERPLGGVWFHGGVMFALAIALVISLGDYRRLTHVVLTACTFYCLLVTVLTLGGWLIYPIDHDAMPWWYLAPALVSIALLILAPPLDGPNGRSDRA